MAKTKQRKKGAAETGVGAAPNGRQTPQPSGAAAATAGAIGPGAVAAAETAELAPETVVAAELAEKRCTPCEKGTPALSVDQVKEYLDRTPHWKLTSDGKRIRREWRVQDFATALHFFNRVGEIAEAEDHHPDLHLSGYRNVAIELSTHALDGLSENDFILAAKIDRLPVELKAGRP
jgi:4a-hydroxytetrahydrobiopterin dehydratase